MGKTKRGKGTKCVVVVDRQGIPVGECVASASPAEVKLAPAAVESIRILPPGRRKPVDVCPVRLIGDKAYDSAELRGFCAEHDIELIAPHRSGRKARRLQDGRSLRRYRHRWTVERTFAWLGNWRRLLVRHERDVRVYHAFLQIAYALIASRHF